MARRPGSEVRCASAGVHLWVLLAPSQRAAAECTQPGTRRGLGEKEGLRGGGACALRCAPPCRALHLSAPRAHANQHTMPAVTFALY
eukprot:3252092-Rhodomonas_salina.1